MTCAFATQITKKKMLWRCPVETATILTITFLKKIELRYERAYLAPTFKAAAQ